MQVQVQVPVQVQHLKIKLKKLVPVLFLSYLFRVPANKGTLHIMKSRTLEINIGLSSRTLGEIHPETALNELRVQGFEILAYRVVESTCEDGKELCLSVRVGVPEDWQVGLSFIADKLGQDCIAFAGFAGARPYASFDGLLWVSSSI